MIISWWRVGSTEQDYIDVHLDDLQHLVHDVAAVAWDRDMEEILSRVGLQEWRGTGNYRPVRMVGQLDGGCLVWTGGSMAPFAEWDTANLCWVRFGQTSASPDTVK